MIENPTTKDIVLKRLAYVPVLILALLMLAPYYWMVIGAFKPAEELSQVPPTFIVESPTLENFFNSNAQEQVTNEEQKGLFQRFPNTEGGFLRYFFNSTFVASSITIGSLLVASMAAFVLAKHRFPGRNLLFLFFISSMMVPWQVTLISGYLVIKEIGWLDTYTALIIPALPRAFVLFFLRQYMLSLPDDLLDAARVDGASEFRIWAQVVLPLVGPALVAMGIFVFLADWNNLVWPLVILQSEELRTLPLVLSTMVNAFSGAASVGIQMAAALVVSLPTLIMFIIFQRQFVRGIALTGMKG
ncbi:MAG: carbohydrate ABC transporter permease [Anaerolineae bacterium]|nr:carbohydrate ABC transporter permease [Anaerolineae bacterium]